jgi:hypothetical protein
MEGLDGGGSMSSHYPPSRNWLLKQLFSSRSRPQRLGKRTLHSTEREIPAKTLVWHHSFNRHNEPTQTRKHAAQIVTLHLIIKHHICIADRYVIINFLSLFRFHSHDHAGLKITVWNTIFNERNSAANVIGIYEFHALISILMHTMWINMYPPALSDFHIFTINYAESTHSSRAPQLNNIILLYKTTTPYPRQQQPPHTATMEINTTTATTTFWH